MFDGRLIGPCPPQGRLCLTGLERCQADVGQADPHLIARAVSAQRQLYRYRGRGKVADLPLEFEVGAPAAGRRDRNPDLHQDLIGLERGRERAEEERGDRDATFALPAHGHDLGAERQHCRRVVVRRIAVSQVAADRGQVPHQGICDDLARVVEKRVPGPDELGLLELRLARERADS